MTSVAAGMPEPATAPVRCGEVFYYLELNLYNRYHAQLCNPLPRSDRERLTTAIPTRHLQLALVIRVNQAHQVAEHHPVFVPQSGAR